MNVENPVVALCADGMAAEVARRPDDARACFERAWALRADDYDACIAAHYVARHQQTDHDAFVWNERALQHAMLAPRDLVRGFMPSLLLNIAHSYERLGRLDEARSHYERAAAHLDALDEDAYADTVRDGIARGLRRVEAASGSGR